MRKWCQPVRGRKLLVRVFSSATEAWRGVQWSRGQMQGKRVRVISHSRRGEGT
jgi:hypothetical protein